MVTTTSITSYLTSQSQTAYTSSSKAATSVQASGTDASAATGTQSSSASTISSLARQLAASAARVDAYGQVLSRSQLAAKANSMLAALTAKGDAAQQARHDKEVPRTNDPELLARAKQATAFMASTRSGATTTATNPFAGLSREQLYYVVFDDSGSYTFNERAAALNEVSRQESLWRDQVSAQGQAEYNQTGKLTKFLTSLLDHYKGLPAIEQALYPEGYASTLETKIAQNLNYRTSNTNAKSFDAVVSDLLGNKTAATTPSATASSRKSTASAQLAGLKLLMQARGSDTSANSATSILQSHGISAGTAGTNTQAVDTLLNSGNASASRRTLFDFLGS